MLFDALQKPSVSSMADYILGTWFISGINEDASEEGLIVFRADGICIQFPSSLTPPQSNLSGTFRLYYSWDDEETLLYRLSPKGTPWTRKVVRTELGWNLVFEGDLSRDLKPKSFPCRKAIPDDLPPWFEEMEEICVAALERRAKKEADQAGASNGG